MHVEHVLSCGDEVGETPIWVPAERALYRVDIEGKRILRYDPADGATAVWDPGVPVTALARGQGSAWMLATKEGIYRWDRDTGQSTFVVDPVADNAALRFNDGAVDRQGRFLIGTMNQEDLTAPDGALYRLDPDGSVSCLDDGYAVANGIAFSPDGGTLYVTDMFNSRILAYDYDTVTGTPSNRRILVEVPSANGLPDGLITDSEGFLWSAHWGGWRITRYDPEGTREREIRFPAANVTCMGFGGEAMTDLYVTTAWFLLSADERAQQPQAGDLFRVRTEIRGLAEPVFGVGGA